MGEKTHHTAVVLIPPEDVWPPIQAIRERHDRHVGRWMPHVTLVYPFRPKEAFETVVGPLSEACEGVAPFEVALGAFRFFQHRQNSFTFWLAPEPKEALVRLQTALWQAVPDCDEVRRYGGGFTPHLSVGQAREQEAMVRLKEELQKEWAPLAFRAEAVSLIWRNDPPDDAFRVACRVALGTGRVTDVSA